MCNTAPWWWAHCTAPGEKTVKLSQLMMLMGLAVKQGQEITVAVEGPQEEKACAALEAFFKENL